MVSFGVHIHQSSGLFLALCSDDSSGEVQGTIRVARDQTQLSLLPIILSIKLHL